MKCITFLQAVVIVILLNLTASIFAKTRLGSALAGSLGLITMGLAGWWMMGLLNKDCKKLDLSFGKSTYEVI